MTTVDDIDLAALEHDPDPLLARLRAEAPVCFVPALDMWLVTRWDDVAEIEAHPERFTAATEPSFLARALGPNLLTTDPPEHTRVRDLLLPPLLPGGRAGAFAADELGALADRLIDSFAARGTVELMAEYAQPLSAVSLATVLGLDAEGADRMWRWCEGLCADIANFENDPSLTALGDAAREELGAVIDRRLDELAGEPDGSALAGYLGVGATRDEIVNNVRLMISGGINEPRDGIGLVVWTLLRRPDLRARVDAEPAAWRRLVEEVLRVHSPVGTITRQTTTNVVLGGVPVPAGALVAGVLRSVNLDEERWRDPTEIDLDRREGSHAAFALGAHRCLGEWLGRQEVRVGAQRLLERLPDAELVPDEPVELHGFEFRGPRAVHLRWPT